MVIPAPRLAAQKAIEAYESKEFPAIPAFRIFCGKVDNTHWKTLAVKSYALPSNISISFWSLLSKAIKPEDAFKLALNLLALVSHPLNNELTIDLVNILELVAPIAPRAVKSEEKLLLQSPIDASASWKFTASTDGI